MRKLIELFAMVLERLGRKRIIYDHCDPTREYLYRYYLIGRRNHKWFTLALHKILISDHDFQHDHPYRWGSLILSGTYIEHTPEGSKQMKAGAFRIRKPEQLHRLELNHGPVWTLFFMGKRVRDWGFSVKGKWVDHQTHLGHLSD